MPRGEADVVVEEVSCGACPVRAARSSWGRVLEVCSPGAESFCEGAERVLRYGEDALADFGWAFFSEGKAKVPMAHLTSTNVPWVEVQQDLSEKGRIQAYFMPQWAVFAELFGRFARRLDTRLDTHHVVNVARLLNLMVKDRGLQQGSLAVTALLVPTGVPFAKLVDVCDRHAARKFIEWVHATCPDAVDDLREVQRRKTEKDRAVRKVRNVWRDY